jgi:dethiobiotin synthetase
LKKIFITGIGTNVGKTIAATIIVEALEADYWKPIQAGDLDNSDTHFLQSKICNLKSKIYENSYKLNTACSPHLAAQIDGITINLSQINEPKTAKNLVIEGAGGIFVPLNDTDCVIDLIKTDYKIIIVSQHYLGSINHTLLTFEALKNRGFKNIGIIFNGNKNNATEKIILQKTNAKFIGRIEEEPYFDKNVIKYYADLFRENLIHF